MKKTVLISQFALSLIAVSVISACGDSEADKKSSTKQVSTQAGQIPLATGHNLAQLPVAKAPFYDITAYGAVPGGAAVDNQKAINAAIDDAARGGGGTVVIPSGIFKTYSVRLKSNVGIHFAARDAILRAAVPGVDGGSYDAPEPNWWVGLQDQGHSHWNNSLIYGIDVKNILISGPGLIDGSYTDPATGFVVNVLSGNDPQEVTIRTASDKAGGANKAVALLRADNIVLRDFKIKNGGHFAILGTEVTNWSIDNLVIDTNRDALDVDSSQNVTIRNSKFNSLTDDAIVLKGSFGGGRYFETRNILIEKCVVSGYDAGSVLAGTYTTNKKVATDRDGPTARIKLGTESTTGFDTVTIKNVTFDRSRGFALESVDGAELKNIVFTDATMNNVSSSPIFIRIGDRGRAPVTNKSSADESVSPENSVRLDNVGWVLPDLAQYGSYPSVRSTPSYSKTHPVTIRGSADNTGFTVVSRDAPARLNPHGIQPATPLTANAVGVGVAKVHDILIDNVTVTNVDPRYPILLAGLVDHPIENLTISNVSVKYRGGLKMEHAIEQRQLNQTIDYSSFETAPATQSVPWLTNTFFAKNEALLPRVSWNTSARNLRGDWENDPYNIPEMPREYPEPSIFGVLPAYGIYARHVKGLTVKNVSIGFETEDERPAVVLDDVDSAKFPGFQAQVKSGTPVFVTVTNTRKRALNREYILEEPYKTTTVTGFEAPKDLSVQAVTISRPAPGTPPDSLYREPTAPGADRPYAYQISSATYPKPESVYPDIR